MLLFNNAEYDSFFNPLCCKNKRIYYECILQLIEKSKSVPLLYETDAKDTIILYLRNCAYAVEDEVASSNADENISSKKTETENAGAILRYFRRCGWISEREIGRNGDNIATVMPYCRKMIEAIERIFNRDNRAALTNHIYHITREPQKLCIKGKALINIGGTEVDISGFSEGIEFQTSELKNIKSVKLMVPYFMTIENRAAYLRYAKDDVVVFYLGGYANRYQRDFIKTVYMSNRNASYLHFGDIDAGGFWIHHNLCEITGVNFELFSMSADELGNKEFASCLHELSGNDRVRLRELKKIDVYEDVVRYMLHNNVKLEQEIVSLTLMRNETNS